MKIQKKNLYKGKYKGGVMKQGKSIFFSLVFFVVVSYSLRADSHRGKSRERIQIRWFTQISNHEYDEVRIIKEEFVERFNNSQDEIELIIDPTSAGCSFDAMDTLIIRVNEGDPPDITDLVCNEIYEHLLDLTPYLDGYDLSDLDSIFLNCCRVDNSLLKFPCGLGVKVIFYNEDLFDQANIYYPPHQFDELYADSVIWNVQKLEEISRLLTLDHNGNNADSASFDPDSIEQYGYHWQWSLPINLFGPGPNVDTNGNVTFPWHIRNAYQWHRDAMYSKYFSPTGEQFDSLENETIGIGKGAMLIGYLYNIQSLKDVTFPWDIAVVPAYGETYHVPWTLGACCVFKASDYPEEAFKVILAMAKDVKLLKGQIPVFKSLRADAIDELKESCHPDVDWEVTLRSIDHLCASSLREALKENLAARRLVNGFENYVEYEPEGDINQAIDYYLIPELEEIFSAAAIEDTKLNDIPRQFNLFPNYPNPSSNATMINYQLPEACEVNLSIYNLLGQEVAALVDEYQTVGKYEIKWSAEGLPGGIYFCQLQGNSFTETRQLVLIK